MPTFRSVPVSTCRHISPEVSYCDDGSRTARDGSPRGGLGKCHSIAHAWIDVVALISILVTISIVVHWRG